MTLIAALVNCRPAAVPTAVGAKGAAGPSAAAVLAHPLLYRRQRRASLVTWVCASGPQVVHGSRDRTGVALTFHGQGPVSMADALLAEAERAGARVTVLAVGTWLGQYPQIAERILRGGHDLGNRHDHLDIAAMEASGAYAEIAGCAQRLRALTGSVGRWFRPSQTRYSTPLIEREARKAGYQTCVSYDVDSLDYTIWTGRDRIHGARIDAARVDRKPASWALRYRHCVARDFARPGQPGTTPGHPDRPAFPLTAQGRS